MSTADKNDREFGELLLAWADGPVLVALAEQLDVNLPAELTMSDEEERGRSFALKVTKFVELGIERDFDKTIGRETRFRQASNELRLARVLGALLLEDRLKEPFFEVALGLYKAEEELAESNRALGESASELDRRVAFMQPLEEFRTIADDLVEARGWVIIEGRFGVQESDGSLELKLREYLIGHRSPLPPEISVMVAMGPAGIALNDLYVTSWGKRRLVVGTDIDLGVFGIADRLTQNDSAVLTIAPVALYERVGHADFFLWSALGEHLRRGHSTKRS